MLQSDQWHDAEVGDHGVAFPFVAKPTLSGAIRCWKASTASKRDCPRSLSCFNSTGCAKFEVPLKVLSVFGTRPEAIKMAPVLNTLAQSSGFSSVICSTGQHREMLDSVLTFFEVKPDYNLDLMTHSQGLNDLFVRIVMAVDPILVSEHPDLVLVHGDTTTAMAVSLAAFHRRIKIGHVEAGLRTYDLGQPWPEELNRQSIDCMAEMLFPPTAQARDNLLREGRGARTIVVTGNTVIDALLKTAHRLLTDDELRARVTATLPVLRRGRRMLLVTGHRRENFGEGFLEICRSLATLGRRDDIQIIYPVHLNPNVREPVYRLLGGNPNINLIEPTDYPSFVWLMQNSHVILTDSGGVQEEAPSLGKPVLVMREVTERPEAVEAGVVELVGARAKTIVPAVERLFDDESYWRGFARRISPYGDGYAARRIVDAIEGRVVDHFEAACD